MDLRDGQMYRLTFSGGVVRFCWPVGCSAGDGDGGEEGQGEHGEGDVPVP